MRGVVERHDVREGLVCSLRLLLFARMHIHGQQAALGDAINIWIVQTSKALLFPFPNCGLVLKQRLLSQLWIWGQITLIHPVELIAVRVHPGSLPLTSEQEHQPEVDNNYVMELSHLP